MEMDEQWVTLRDGAIFELGVILARARAQRIFLVLDDNAYKESGAENFLEPLIQSYQVTRFSEFEANPKIEDVERGAALYRNAQPDLIVTVGGGTALDLGKLLRAANCRENSLREIISGSIPVVADQAPLVAIPTTAGTGSEATHFAVVYVAGEKHSLAHASLLPEYAIIDPVLTRSMPPSITASTGLDAFCQAIESIWSVGATEQSLAFAKEAASLAIEHLEVSTNNPAAENFAARLGMARASHLAGKAINISKTTASHALSYAITSKFGIPHGIAVALTIRHMLAYNGAVTERDCLDPRGAEHVLKRIAMISQTLGVESVTAACEQIEKLISAVGCPVSLRDAGITSAAEIRWIVSRVNQERLSNNPRQANAEVLYQLLSKKSAC